MTKKDVFNKSSKTQSEAYWIDEQNIYGAIDSLGNKSFFYKLYFNNMPANTFYNIVVTERVNNNDIEPFVLAYEFENGEKKSMKYYGLDFFLDALKKRKNKRKSNPYAKKSDEEFNEPIDITECGDLLNGNSGGDSSNNASGGTGTARDPNGTTNTGNGNYVSFGSYSVINYRGGGTGIVAIQVGGGTFKFDDDEPGEPANALKSSKKGGDNDRVICPEGELIIVVNNVEEIINNLTGKADCVYGKMEDNSVLSKTLEKFNGKKTPINLILIQESNLRDNKGTLVHGYTEYGESYNITIILNTEQANNRPSLAVARTIIHEVIHAEIYRKIKSTSGISYNSTTKKYSLPDGSRPNFPSLFDAYNEDPNNPYHNYMAKFYRNALEEGMREYASSIGKTYPDQLYKDLAWNGLLETKAWDKQYADKDYADKEKERILKAIVNFEKSGNNECN